ncbi:MAG: hypothetical protein FE78DRAFT_75014 [Acidomyces sp. 'richmondensis']|nr:MAG: hypothetical protein FE78DRAFT_75014 [Acidomyces sp. 'richmondensis']
MEVMSETSSHNHMLSSAGMDVVTQMVLESGGDSYEALLHPSTGTDRHGVARDSLSPLCDTSKDRDGISHDCMPDRGRKPTRGMREAATEQEVWKSSSTSTREHATAIANTSTTNSPKEACSPRCKTLLSRPHRPTNLKLNKSNGLTTFTASELKRAICDGHAAFNACATKTQVSQPKSNKRIPKTEDPVAVSMGNNQSGISEPADGADDASIGSVVRKPMRVLRKSSTYLFKRNDSKSPLPRPLTATSILVNQEMSSATDEENTIDPFNDPAHSARDSIIMLPSTSTMTIIDGAEEALGPSITVKESKSDQIPDQAPVEESSCDLEDPPIIAERRSAALSPTIPAPSPLPEDSPHKYGLKDRMDTPEPLQEPPEDINVVKARRRNSGLEIFNEAKSLQSASSFLNGLSTSRRRAESMNRTTDTWCSTLIGSTSTSRPTSRPPSARPLSRPGSVRPLSATHLHGHGDIDGRRRGHNFKSNGVAFSRPLSITQIRCYRNHTRLLMSKNKHAPVECAVCHMDDDQEHWTCSWCAIRMCRYCRKDFAERGITALRQRIKQAELGGGLSASSSSESLDAGRGRSRALA